MDGYLGDQVFELVCQAELGREYHVFFDDRLEQLMLVVGVEGRSSDAHLVAMG